MNLITVSENHFELLKVGTPWLKVTPTVELLENGNVTKIVCEAWLDGAGSVTFSVEGTFLRETVLSLAGYVKCIFTLENARLWNGVYDPWLYTLKAELTANDSVYDALEVRFGCRVCEIDPQKGFFLNGKSYPLRDVSRHQDRQGIGSALIPEMHFEDMALIREMGCNSIRLAHYQHAQEFFDLCDEYGMLVWAEILLSPCS